MSLTDQQLDAISGKLVETLKSIYDPEIPVDIYELGLIYDAFVNEEGKVKVVMTLTTPNCPVAESMPQEVKEKVAGIEGVVDAEVELTFDPPWDRDMMSEEAKFELGFL
ncbi:MAG TPA: SUF system Fe-S cluster assembly protein [Moheibacter sp.]|nr:SUF system Fe-S cluster assembly protein [Moheibacter sp.]